MYMCMYMDICIVLRELENCENVVTVYLYICTCIPIIYVCLYLLFYFLSMYIHVYVHVHVHIHVFLTFLCMNLDKVIKCYYHIIYMYMYLLLTIISSYIKSLNCCMLVSIYHVSKLAFVHLS